MDINHSKHRIKTNKIKLGIFFALPTQHHSVMFKYLSKNHSLDVKIYYYDPGLLGNMFDHGYATSEPWDIDLLEGTHSKIMWNLLRGRKVHPLRQFNPEIIKFFFKEQFDAVFLFGYVSPSNWLALCLAKMTKTHILYQSDSNIFDEQRKNQPFFKRIPRKLFLKNIDTFLVIGDKNRDAYIQFGCDPKRMVYSPYPVDVERFRTVQNDPELATKLDVLRKKYEIPSGAQVVAFCGKLLPGKRPQDVIEAVLKLKDDNIYCLIIGSGPMEKSLRELYINEKRIRITGFVNQSMIPYHMLLADVGVIASKWDQHPLVTTEFAACGLPVIVSNFCGVWGDNDILHPGENGLLYTCGNVEELADCLDKILGNDSLRLQMGKSSKTLAERQSANYAAEIIANYLKQIFPDS